MKDLFVEKGLEVTLKYLKINTRKFWTMRILLGVGVLLMLIMAFAKTHNVWFIVISPFVAYGGYKIPYLKVSSIKNRAGIINAFLFPKFLRTFISLLGTQGNVYQTLVATIPFLDEPLKSEVERLVIKIEKSNDRKHYLDFADFIDSNEAYLIMSMIYEFSMVGTSKEMLSELERYIEEIQKNKTSELQQHKVVKMEKHSNLPVINSVLFILAFTFSIMYYYISQVGNVM